MQYDHPSGSVDGISRVDVVVVVDLRGGGVVGVVVVGIGVAMSMMLVMVLPLYTNIMHNKHVRHVFLQLRNI